MAKSIEWYDQNAERMAALYEIGSFDSVHGWLVDLLPPPPAAVLDVGAGSGRDASWFALKGYGVVAVEPSTAMRSIGERLHSHAPIHWVDDRLPNLGAVSRSGATFDVILLSAVWMHIRSRDRAAVLDKLLELLKPGGILAMTFREGPAHCAAGINRVSLTEVKALARERDAVSSICFDASLRLGRNGSSWNQVALVGCGQ